MPSFSWSLVFVAVLVIVLKTNVRARLILFNWLTYLSLTGWYYYRRLTTSKPHSPNKSPAKKKSSSSNSQSNKFENTQPTDGIKSAPVVHTRRVTSSSSGNSSGDEKPAPKSHVGIFRNLRTYSLSKSDKVDQRKSSVSTEDPSLSTRSASSSLSGRSRTFSGKKKPPSWGS